MIIYANQLDESAFLEADVCIIGGGPAGISVALELQPTNKKIILLAGGTERETVANQDLNKGYVTPKGSHEPLEENRRRAFGGASTVWGGRCIPFDPIDFEARDWIPYSGWPFSYHELEPYYSRAMELCKAGANNFNALEQFPNHAKEIFQGFDTEAIVSHKLERWSTPVNFARDYAEVLGNSENITVLLGAHVTKINTETDKENVSSVSVVTRDKSFTIKAGQYVLACGGIENPRILLASKNQFHPQGIGNDHDVVGRYYMAHLNGTFAEVAPSNRKRILFDFETDNEGVYCRRRWWITDKAQEAKKIGNGIFFLQQAKNQDGHRDPLFSTVFVAKFVISVLKEKSFRKTKSRWLEEKDKIVDHTKVILKHGWKQVPVIYEIAKKRFSDRRLPFVLPSVKSKTLGLYFQTEHFPNPKSRITISDNQTDEFGMPRAVASITFSDLDVTTVVEAHKIFAERYSEANIGKIKFNASELLKFVEKNITSFNTSAHHLGTTRISNDPKLGVVDADCKVHGMNNLYVAGSSVFPTGGHANPTLTLVALSVRLAEHLKKAAATVNAENTNLHVLDQEELLNKVAVSH
ncbi:FAD-dependent oxidoreductase [Pontibacter sp. SGAir0037]|uniref:FAD-dependent oxidoreductase n=1 Tax=Pontibacter sp. SGAir0037 TaxID=2571030 RepID=UPI0010CCF452|nr:GMC family oxidoreductase [Pontibacter sp. SGAir0037]QCR22819.1 hypothetical protein C1N53_11015 [Pontibacter sp. SGAir0037]